MPKALIPFLLLVVPIAEIGAFIAIGGRIGTGLTLLMILVTAIIGTILLRIQGLGLINKIQTQMAAGKIPGRALGDGAMIMVAGILLLTPGFITDAIGFSLFVPFIRTGIWKFLSSKVSVAIPGMMHGMGTGMDGSMGGGMEAGTKSSFGDSYHTSDSQGPIIDLDEEDYHCETDNGDSPWSKPR